MSLPYDINNHVTGLPPSCFSDQSSGSTDSGDPDEALSSPTGSLSGSSVEAPFQLQLGSAGTSEGNQGSTTQEMSNEECQAWNETPNGPEYTCRWVKASGVKCGKTHKRADRFRYHVQGHLGVTPYACADSPKIDLELKCDRKFWSATARDTHVKNKKPVTCDCNTKVLPKNVARHRMNCPACSSLHPEPTTSTGSNT